MGEYYGSGRKGKGSFGGFNYNNNNTRRSSSSRRETQHGEDFEEGDVWEVANVINERESSSSSMANYGSTDFNGSYSSSSSSSAWQFSGGATSTPRIAIAPPPQPRARSSTTSGGDQGGRGKVGQQSSAPVNIPDWSKIYGNGNGRRRRMRRQGNENGNGDVGPTWSDNYGGGGGGEVEDDGEEEEEMVPPHEWLARKLAGSQISSFSVCEGIGRTLKGRDLSQVRNAILTKTGFLE